MRTSKVCFAAVVIQIGLLAGAGAQGQSTPVVVVRPVDMTTITGGKYPLVAGQIVQQRKSLDGGRIKVAAGPVGTLPSDSVAKPDAALASFTKAIEAKAEDAAPRQARGVLLFSQGKLKEAIIDLDRAIELKPTSTAYVYRAFAWKRSGAKDKAMSDVNEAIRLDPQNGLAWRVRGATYAGLGEYPKTLADYTESIRVQPENTESLHHRVMLTSICVDDSIRNGKQALADATRACELTEWTDPMLLTGLASAHAELGDFDKAIEILETAKKTMPAGQGSRFDSQLASYRAKKPIRYDWRR